VRAEASEANRLIPILVAHGTDDDVVSPALGRAAFDFLEDEGYRPVWHDYPMPHAVCLEEIIAIGEWLKARLS